jgi:cytochrome c oxidase assembly factor CtaG
MSKSKKCSWLVGIFSVIWLPFLLLLMTYEPRIHRTGWPAMEILLWILGIACIVLFAVHQVLAVQLEEQDGNVNRNR